MPTKRKIIIAITGASGSIYVKRLLNQLLLIENIEVGLVWSKNAKDVWNTELEENSFSEYKFPVYDINDFTAPFASGSAQYDTMVIIPCSMGVLGRVANGLSSDLITRAADVILKERRKLICVVRETPYNLIHIKNMEAITLAGGIICPATPSYYSKPTTIEEVADTVVHRVIDLAQLKQSDIFRWGS